MNQHINDMCVFLSKGGRANEYLSQFALCCRLQGNDVFTYNAINALKSKIANFSQMRVFFDLKFVGFLYYVTETSVDVYTWKDGKLSFYH
jgi:hypothetical protein